ncbi:MAG: glycosyltransferase family protein, partial [Natronosporangium sp.]
AVLGGPVMGAVRPGALIAELGRVVRAGGELRIVVTGSGGTDGGGITDAVLADLLEALGETFQIRSVTTTGGRTVITAVCSRGPVDVRGVLAGLIVEFHRARLEQQRAAAELTGLEKELAQTRDELRDRDARIDEHRVLAAAQTRRVETLSASLTALRDGHKSVAAARDEAAAQARAYQTQLNQLQVELAEAEYRARYERWRADVTQKRKWWRVGGQLNRLRKPWRVPVVAYRIARIVVGPSFRPTPPTRSDRPAAVPRAASAGPSKRTATSNLRFPAFELPSLPPRRPGLRVATILDEFSELSLRYEFQLVPVPRTGWQEVIDRQPVDLLLVESAWNGNNGDWKYAFTGEEVPKKSVLELLAHCRERGIPTVFWNKEDPLEYDLFIRSARHFDWVFTVDENCVARYRADLGHDRVGVFPFGVQPRIHNPVGSFGPRNQDVAFAGTYYSGKYPDRKEQIENLLAPCVDLGLHIFSRWQSLPKYRFPEHLEKSVVGSLDYPDMLTAYRRYKVFLNVNSVVDSKTMFSRRVLELLACGTPVVSGPSVGMTAMLGAGVVDESTGPEPTRYQVRALLQSQELRDRRAVTGIRSVMSGQTYSDRVDALLDSMGLPSRPRRRRVSIVAPTNRPGGFAQILENVGRQEHRDVELILALHGISEDVGRIRQVASEQGVADLEILPAPAEWSLGRMLNEACRLATGDFIAKMDDDDLYGARYLSDQLLAFEYTEADIVGKWSRFIFLESVPCLGVLLPGHEHRYTELVGGGSLLVKKEVFEAVRFADRRVGEDTQFLRDCRTLGFRTYSTDRFNLVVMRHRDPSRHTFKADHLHHLSNTRVVSFSAALEHAFV